MSGTGLPLPEPGDEIDWVGRHLAHLCSDEPARSRRFVGTQAAADAALDALDLQGYARRRNEVQPASRRGATALSPWIRHGLLTLPRVWAASTDAPAADRRKFRDELRWQEYARHLYARLGDRTAAPLRRSIQPAQAQATATATPWDRSMRCVEINLDELEHDGWMVNQTRMWLASQWSVRHRADSPPEAVWLTAESLGDDDPALSANPGLPAVFVFDEALLRRLSLSSKRLVFLVDRLAELAAQHPLEIHLGDPVEVLAGRPLATTFAPVPGWRSRAAVLDVAELHPWPWLERPRSGSIASFSAWRRAADPRDDARAGSTGTVRGSPTARYDRATPQGVADMANADDIQIFEGPTDQPYTSVGPIKARVGAKTAFSKAPTPDAVNVKLRGEAAKMGANAVINVQYERGISAMSWKALTATGEAVVLQPTGTA